MRLTAADLNVGKTNAARVGRECAGAGLAGTALRPVPLRETAAVDLLKELCFPERSWTSGAEVTSERFPLTVPPDTGVKLTVKVALLPAASVMGNAHQER